MAPHTTFGIGGKADLFARPGSLSGLASLLSFAKEESLPICVIGGGANILVSDLGIRG
jgi:UDP-N-acetylmuramate dehydrogenase